MSRVTVSEDAIRKAAKAFAKKLGGFHKRMHFGPGATVGWPDDFFMFLPEPTRVVPRQCWIEFKASGKNAEPIQLHTHVLMREYGQLVYVCNSVAQTEFVLTRISQGYYPEFDVRGLPILAVH